MMEFKEWWEDQTKDSDQWTTLERLAAKDAWEFATRQSSKRAPIDWPDFVDEIKIKLESIVEKHRHDELVTCQADCWCWEVDAVCMEIDRHKSEEQRKGPTS